MSNKRPETSLELWQHAEMCRMQDEIEVLNSWLLKVTIGFIMAVVVIIGGIAGGI